MSDDWVWTVSNSQWTGKIARETCSQCSRPYPAQVTVVLKPRARLQRVIAIVNCQCGAAVPLPLNHSGEGKESTVFIPDDEPPRGPHLKVVR